MLSSLFFSCCHGFHCTLCCFHHQYNVHCRCCWGWLERLPQKNGGLRMSLPTFSRHFFHIVVVVVVVLFYLNYWFHFQFWAWVLWLPSSIGARVNAQNDKTYTHKWKKIGFSFVTICIFPLVVVGKLISTFRGFIVVCFVVKTLGWFRFSFPFGLCIDKNDGAFGKLR